MSPDALLTADQITFMQGPVSIIASSHSADLKSNLVRANRALAVVFCRPTTGQALQVKATDADIIGVQRDGVRITRHYHEMMIAEIAPLSFAPPMLRAMFACTCTTCAPKPRVPCSSA